MAKKQTKKETNKQTNIVNNALADEAFDIPPEAFLGGAPIATYNGIFKSTAPVFITLTAWWEITCEYAHNGFMQSAINQIVDDAFRNDGLQINTKTLDDDELEKLKQALEDNGDIEAIKDAIRWGQLYGGGVLLANTPQDPELPVDEKQLKGERLKFLATDRWHCDSVGVNIEVAKKFRYLSDPRNITNEQMIFDRSRVATFCGIKAPEYLRSIMCGWGLSIFEAILPPLTQYLKAMGVTLELLDEAKIDILKIANLNSMALSAAGKRQIRERIRLFAEQKNYKSVGAMDVTDDYLQKQVTFSGIPEMITQIQYLVCSALKRPYSKVFGKGGSGLSEQTSDLENYAAIVDAEIRQPAKQMCKWVVDLRCLQLFGRKLPDLKISWKPIRTMTEQEEADIKDKEFARYMQLFDRHLIKGQALATHLVQEGIIPFTEDEINEIDDDFQPDEMNDIRDLSEA